MNVNLTPAEIETLLNALNDREGVLSTDWEAATRANSVAGKAYLSKRLDAVRALAYKLQQKAPAVGAVIAGYHSADVAERRMGC